MEIRGTSHCCSVMDFSGLNDGPRHAVDIMKFMFKPSYGLFYRHGRTLGTSEFRGRGGHVMFTQVRVSPNLKSDGIKTRDNLERFEAFVRENGLGEFIVQEDWHKNPNSNRFIKAGWWSPDLDACESWAQENDVKIRLVKPY